MPRYIDAEILEHKFIEWRADLKEKKETAKTQREAKRTSDIAAGVVCCLMELCDAPTADVQEVKHVRWEDYYVGDSLEGVICTVCKKTCVCEFDYCPNCGAKMDGDAR